MCTVRLRQWINERLGDEGVGKPTKRVAVAYFGPPATYEMDLVLGNGGHLRVPAPDQLGVLFDILRLDLVEDNRVDVLAAG